MFGCLLSVTVALSFGHKEEFCIWVASECGLALIVWTKILLCFFKSSVERLKPPPFCGQTRVLFGRTLISPFSGTERFHAISMPRTRMRYAFVLFCIFAISFPRDSPAVRGLVGEGGGRIFILQISRWQNVFCRPFFITLQRRGDASHCERCSRSHK